MITHWITSLLRRCPSWTLRAYGLVSRGESHLARRQGPPWPPVPPHLCAVDMMIIW